MLRQTLQLTDLGLRSMGRRLGTSSIVVVGIGGVVAVLVALLAMASGFRAALADTGKPDRALVLRTGAADEITSWLTAGELAVVSGLPGVAIASGELFVVADLALKSTGDVGVAIARGVGPAAFELRGELTITRGRNLQPGRNELIAGLDAVATYEGLGIGDEINVRDHAWTVVGHFAGAGAHDSEVWLDLAVAQSAFRRSGSVSSVRVRLEPGASVNAIGREVEDDPRLSAGLVTEEAFYREQARDRTRLIESFALLVSSIMAIGAVIAAYSTMHASLSARQLEIATLRALGFGAGSIVASLLMEAMLLALLGGLLGAGLIYLLYDGYVASTLNSRSMSQIAFEFAVTPELVLLGIAGALALGLLGGLAPSLSAVRSVIADALRED